MFSFFCQKSDHIFFVQFTFNNFRSFFKHLNSSRYFLFQNFSKYAQSFILPFRPILQLAKSSKIGKWSCITTEYLKVGRQKGSYTWPHCSSEIYEFIASLAVRKNLINRELQAIVHSNWWWNQLFLAAKDCVISRIKAIRPFLLASSCKLNATRSDEVLPSYEPSFSKPISSPWNLILPQSQLSEMV